jgi:SAM-dependent methyltransferase
MAYVDLSPGQAEDVNLGYDEGAVAMMIGWYARRGRRRERAFYESVLARHGRGGARFLDVGCGLGGAVAVAQDRGFAARGVDPSPWAELARERWGLPLDHALVQDLPPASFDVVFTSAPLEHILEPLAFLSAIRRVLAPGGVAITAGVPNHREWSVTLGLSWFPNNRPPHHVNYFEPDSLRRAHEAAGFRTVRVSTYGCDFPVQLAERILCNVETDVRPGGGTGAPISSEQWELADIRSPRNLPRLFDRLAWHAYASARPPDMGSMLLAVAHA